MPDPLRWDEPSPVLTWDSPSLTWDGVRPAPPQPPAKKKPFHRTPKPSNPKPPTPTTTMSTFKYNIAPLASGGFTTRAVRGALADEAAITAAIAASTGVTPAQVPAVIQAFFDKILLCSAGCDWSPEIYDCISFRSTSGGSKALPTDFHNADDINADIAISLSAAKIRQWRAGLTLESMGEVGLITPVIDSILDITTGQPDKYTVANMIQLRGGDLRFKLSDVTQGTFFRSGNDPEVRATLYGQNEPGVVSAAVPAALTGPLTVRHAAFINGSVRSYHLYPADHAMRFSGARFGVPSSRFVVSASVLPMPPPPSIAPASRTSRRTTRHLPVAQVAPPAAGGGGWHCGRAALPAEQVPPRGKTGAASMSGRCHLMEQEGQGAVAGGRPLYSGRCPLQADEMPPVALSGATSHSRRPGVSQSLVGPPSLGGATPDVNRCHHVIVSPSASLQVPRSSHRRTCALCLRCTLCATNPNAACALCADCTRCAPAHS